jgi:hypothetical protein
VVEVENYLAVVVVLVVCALQLPQLVVVEL